ncbi:MAG: hypothetical protein M3Q05_13440 [Bacteroidota bacterium]|nr:hypothetical protein [Bacteroidota bacterium]
MKDFEIRVATEADVPAVVNLANQYTFQNLSEQERQTGFLTGVFTEVAVRSMITSAPSIVAYNQQELAGFILNTNLLANQYPPLVQEIIKELSQLMFREIPVEQFRYFFYGPVLVARKYRQHGLLKKLFMKTKEELSTKFNLGIAFIDQDNDSSFRVHKNLGWEVIGEILFNNRTYAILAFAL